VLLNDRGEVSIQHARKWDYYKLTGGCVEIGETEEDALRREIIEEVGCAITIEDELGIILEWRNQRNLLYLSYGYLCRVHGDIGKPQYEQDEIDDDFKPIWIPLEESIKLMKQHMRSQPYEARFMVTIEKRFLEEARNLLKKALD